MARNKTKRVAIRSESIRKATLERRRDGLFKKAKELSILCDVEVGVIVQDEEKRDEFVWPAHKEVEENLVRFLDIPEIKRNQKMSTYESFLAGELHKKIEYIWKLYEKNDEKERESLVHKLMNGKITIKELEMLQTHGLTQLMLNMMTKVENRIQSLDKLEEKEQSLLTANPDLHSLASVLAPNKGSGAQESGKRESIPAPESVEDFKNDQWFIDSHTNASIPDPKMMEDERNDQWFMEKMFDKQNISYKSCESEMQFYHTNAGRSEGNNLGYNNPEATTSGGNHIDVTPPNAVADPSFGIYNGFPDVEWPYIFFPSAAKPQPLT